MKEKILIKEFIKNRKVGAIASTSKYVLKNMINKIDFDKANILIEYGSGKGIITKQLLDLMKNDAILFAFETNENFIEDMTKINDKRLIIINADAEDARIILKNRYKIKQVNYIISTIPFTLYDRRKRKRIIYRSYSMLKEKGKFITYQYSWLIYNLIKNRFSKSSIKATLFNLPPAFIFEGIK